MRTRCLAILVLLLMSSATGVRLADAGPLGMAGTDVTSPDGVAYTLYSGTVPSFDGVPLDVDLTVPQGPIAARPLVVMLHGWGGSKSDWEAAAKRDSNPDKDGYNNVAFVARGYAVLNYTARGFHGSCGPEASPTPACDRGWTHLADRRFEIRDTKYLVGLLTDEGVAVPDRIGVTGGSYGGGQSWLLALEGDRVSVADPTDPERVTLAPWVSPAGTPMHLAVAVPKYPWSDLVNALVPNGRASDGVLLADGNRLQPVGIMKQSYVSGLFALGATTAKYAPPGADPTADLIAWYDATQAGEPYRPDDPVLANALHQLTTWKSPYYQDALIAADAATRHEVPVLDIQGWTDALFPEVEGIAIINKLRAADRGWPLSAWVADVGHAIAQNKPSDWVPINAAANALLDNYLQGSGANVTGTFTVRVTTCDASLGRVFTAGRWGTLARNRLLLSASGSQVTASAPSDQPAGLDTDPIANGGKCITLPASSGSSSSDAVWQFPLTASVTLLGAPVVSLDVNVSGTDAELNARLWDVAPDGSRTLVTRGAYRFNGSAGATSVSYPLFGNAWLFAAGHTVRLELTQNDAPFLRLDNLPSSVVYNAVRLTLPLR